MKAFYIVGQCLSRINSWITQDFTASKALLCHCATFSISTIVFSNSFSVLNIAFRSSLKLFRLLSSQSLMGLLSLHNQVVFPVAQNATFGPFDFLIFLVLILFLPFVYFHWTCCIDKKYCLLRNFKHQVFPLCTLFSCCVQCPCTTSYHYFQSSFLFPSFQQTILYLQEVGDCQLSILQLILSAR